MITTLNIPAPQASPIHLLGLIRVAPPVLPCTQYCGIVKEGQRETCVCALIHSYSAAHIYVGAFPALLPLVFAKAWPGRQISEINWVDIAYMRPDRARPYLIVRTAKVDSPTAEIVWQDRDLSYARSWESRTRPVIELLDRVNA